MTIIKQKVDLLLGSNLGVWILQNVLPDQVGTIITLDEDIAQLGRHMGITVHIGDVNSLLYQPTHIGLSVHYPKILQPKTISNYYKIYNIHPGYLPWGRGFYPVFWALFDDTPAGATLHEITVGVDKGPIVEQVQVKYFPDDTGGTLHERVTKVEEQLLLKYWPMMVMQQHVPTKQQIGTGSYHSKKEFLDLKTTDVWKSFTPEKLLKLVKALTYPGYSGLEVSFGNKRFGVNLEFLRSLDTQNID